MVKYFDYVEELRQTLTECSVEHGAQALPMPEALEFWIEKTHRISLNGKQIFLLGNGASATMAEHLAFDVMKNGKIKTVGFSEAAYLTAMGNDLCFEDVFSLKLERLAAPEDMLVTISSSGNSPNVIRALECAQKLGLFTVTLSAMKPDNKSRRIGDLNFYVPAPTYGLAESAHSALLHIWLDAYLDKYRDGRK